MNPNIIVHQNPRTPQQITVNPKQEAMLDHMYNMLRGTYSLPNMESLVSLSVTDKDAYTQSLFVRIETETMESYVWVRTGGAITDIDGKNLKLRGIFCKLPIFRKIPAKSC